MVYDIGIEGHVEDANNEALERTRLSRPILIDIMCEGRLTPNEEEFNISCRSSY